MSKAREQALKAVPSTLKINPLNKNQDFKDGVRVRGLRICSFVTNIRDCTQTL